jgi:hypothetical protein
MKWHEHLNQSRNQGRVETVVVMAVLAVAVDAFRKSKLADKADEVLWAVQDKIDEWMY